MPDTYGEIEAVFKTAYSNNVLMAVQDMKNNLEETASFIADVSGKDYQAVELLGSEEAFLDYPEEADTPHVPSRHLGIFVRPRRINWGKLVKNSISLKALTDPTSAYVKNGVNAHLRRRKEIFVNAIFGARLIKTTEDGLPTPVPFDTTNQRIVSGGTGLTVPKFLAAMEKFMSNQIDPSEEEITALITSKENTSLFNGLQVTSKDYRDKAVFEDKRVMSFMGVKIVHYERLPLLGAERRVPFYCKSGMHFGNPVPIRTSLERRADKQNQVHPYMEEYYCATRSEDEKVVEVLCA